MQAFSIGSVGIGQIRKLAVAHLSLWWRVAAAFYKRARTVPRTLRRALTIKKARTEDPLPAKRAPENVHPPKYVFTFPNQPVAAKEERRRLAAQIHHGLAQHMAHALMQLQLCQRDLAANPARGQEFLHNALRFAQIAMDATRATIYELQYPSNQCPRIASVLHATASRLGSLATTKITVDVDEVGLLSPAMESGLCAIACEALTNAVKHAAAEQINVSLRQNQEAFVLEVTDDGIGFDPNAAQANHGAFGLKLMRDQAERLGGTLQIEHRSGGGTLVRSVVRSPLRPSAGGRRDPTRPHAYRENES